ncbi:HEAT repeat domain-containing protein [Streptomyces mirabilis]|uniref:HEAT repeat domain-containing protein n=1 Tax=Streptomyces mirabilis TaxID=68239 RepID=UPI00363DA1C7
MVAGAGEEPAQRRWLPRSTWHRCGKCIGRRAGPRCASSVVEPSSAVRWRRTGHRRRSAIWLLGFVPEPSDLNLLAHAAQDSDEGIRSAVVGTLGSHGTEPAAIDLLLNLLDDPSPQVRISALSSLGFLQQPRTLRKIRLLANDDNPRVRAWVAIAVGRFSALEPADPATSSVLDQRTPTRTFVTRQPRPVSASPSAARRAALGKIRDPHHREGGVRFMRRPVPVLVAGLSIGVGRG